MDQQRPILFFDIDSDGKFFTDRRKVLDTEGNVKI